MKPFWNKTSNRFYAVPFLLIKRWLPPPAFNHSLVQLYANECTCHRHAPFSRTLFYCRGTEKNGLHNILLFFSPPSPVSAPFIFPKRKPVRRYTVKGHCGCDWGLLSFDNMLIFQTISCSLITVSRIPEKNDTVFHTVFILFCNSALEIFSIDSNSDLSPLS